ncbi:UNVERIFIED_ORG: hypothetical protein GGD58_001754 [Rhizobium pisi]
MKASSMAPTKRSDIGKGDTCAPENI